MLIRFWGVRGSISAPGPQTVRYGGNTPCIEVRTASGEMFVLDAGYGVVGLGNALMAAAGGQPQTVHLLLTHLHWDHIQGLPFFTPIYIPGNRIVIHSDSERTAREAMDRLFTSIYSPIMGVENLGSKIEYEEIGAGGLALGGASIEPFALRHSVPTLGLRIVDAGKVLIHATDHEGGEPVSDGRLVALATNADLLVHDAQFTAPEHARYSGWGHSSTEAATQNALAAGAKLLALYHYDATHSDDDVDAQLRHARDLTRDSEVEVVAAAEGMVIEI